MGIRSYIKTAVKKVAYVGLKLYHLNGITKTLLKPVSAFTWLILPRRYAEKVAAFSREIVKPKVKKRICERSYVWDSPRLKNTKNVRRAVVCASFDASGILPEYLVEILKDIRKLSQFTVLVADNGIAERSEIKKVEEYVDHAEFVRHKGYDFNSYKRGFLYIKEKLSLSDIDEIVFINDSCYGPIFPFSGIFEAMEKRKCDFWGLCDSHEFRHHIQSFFFVFKNQVFNSRIFNDFLSAIPKRLTWDQACSLELQFTECLEKQFAPDAFVRDFARNNSRMIIAGNQNGTCWPLAQLKKGMPLVKVKAMTGAFGSDMHDDISETLSFIKCVNPKQYEVICRDLARRGVPATASDEMAVLERCKVVSFDVFDTLLVRPFAAPTDIFLLIEKKYDAVGYAKQRIDAEKRARLHHPEKEDVTLAEIYQEIEPEYYSFMHIEKEMELDLLSTNPLIIGKYNNAKKKSKKIICTSDMYLDSATIYQALRNNKIAVDDIYVSSEQGVIKGTGKLYDLVLQREGVNASELLHYGDNKVSDYIMALRSGANACLKEKYIDTVLAMPGMIKIKQFWISNMTFPASAYVAMVAEYVLSMPLETTYWNYIGFCFGGPLVLSYLLFIAESSKKNGIDKLFFVSRDGKVLKEAYDEIIVPSSLFSDLPPSEYVYLSRSVCLQSNILSKDEPAYVKLMLEKAKANHPEICISGDLEKDRKTLDRYWQTICSESLSDRINLTKYLEEKAGDSESIAVVDMTGGTMSAYRAGKTVLGKRVRLGLFSISSRDQSDLPRKCLSSIPYAPEQVPFVKFSELLVSSAEGPIVGLSGNSPIFGKEQWDREQIYPEIAVGIKQYVRGALDKFGADAKHVTLPMEQWMVLAKCFFTYPSYNDIEYFNNIVDTPDVENQAGGAAFGEMIREYSGLVKR